MITKLNKIKSIQCASWIRKNYCFGYKKINDLYGDNVLLDFGKHMFISKDPEVVRKILLDPFKDFTRSKLFKAYLPLLGNGILVKEGKDWKKSREILNQTIYLLDIKNKEEKINQVIKEQIDLLDLNSPVEITNFSRTLVMKIVGVLFFDKIFISNSEKIQALFDQIGTFLSKKQKKIFFHHSIFSPIKSFQTNKKIKDLNELVKLICDDSIDSHLINKFRELKMEDFHFEVINFILASYETTVSSLSFALYHLGKSPRLQERLANKPTLIDNVIYETQRIYPPVGVILRRTQKDVQFNKFFIPNNSEVVCNTYGIHHDNKYFKNPEEFNPLRFSTTKGIPYFPFGFGPTICPGKDVALKELNLILFYIIKNFKINSLTKNISIKTDGIVKPDRDIFINLK